MEPILLFIGSFWWIAPALVGAGAAAYGGLTAKSRRARRLDLDAARHQESIAYRALVEARAGVGAARANAAAARIHAGAPIWDAVVPSTPETVAARQRLNDAKRVEHAASLELVAIRSRVRAADVHYHATSSRDPLPIEKLWAAHDAVNARWLAYETDPAKAIDYPQMGDARHPATLVFLRAQRRALELRPSSARDRIDPARYLEYRDAVHGLEAAFAEAERQVGESARKLT